MIKLHDGQCGLCAYFGEHDGKNVQIIQIQKSKEAPENVTEACEYPQFVPLHLVVTPSSGCSAFKQAEAVAN